MSMNCRCRKCNRTSKWVVCLLTFFSYVFFHATRKSFSTIKSAMARQEWMRSDLFAADQQSQMYGLMDMLFMGFYAIGLYISGLLGDRYNLRKMIAYGMWVTASISVLFGLGAFSGIRSLSFYATIWAINGLVQSSGWPANVAVMGKWFGHEERGAVLGVWSGNACFGNIIGAGIVSSISNMATETTAWKYSMIVVGSFVAVHGAIIFFFLEPSPHSESGNYQLVNSDELSKFTSDGMIKSDEDLPTLSFWRAWLIPGVIPYSLSYLCLKSVNYALFFWLPLYLTVSLKMTDSRAGFFSMLYDFGQIFGGFAGGLLTDKMGVRSPVIVSMLLLAGATIHFFHNASQTLTAILLVVSGFLVGGPANLISTAISADLGTDKSIRGNHDALATVTGIIDGTGSIGAAIIQYFIGRLANCHFIPINCDPQRSDCVQTCNWEPVFVMLVLGCLASSLCLVSLLKKEILYLRRARGAQ